MRRRLLFVSARYLFPADSGGKIRTAGVLRGMKGGEFEITLASPLPPVGMHDAGAIAEVCDRFVGWPMQERSRLHEWTRLRHLVSPLPVPVVTDYCEAGRAVLAAEIAARPDVLVIDFPHAAVLAPPPYPVPSVIFTHNVEAEIFQRHATKARDAVRRAVWRNQARKMERYEKRVLAGFDTVVAVAERDGAYFRSAYGIANVGFIPTGVDFEYFAYRETPASPPAGAGSLVFTASMDSMANIDAVEHFLEDVWPRLRRLRPQATFTVVGRNPPARLVERAAGQNVIFTGFVDDVRPYVHRAHVYVIPLRIGGGTRIKVYEAMAMGCPVVSTPLGVEGLPVEDGRHFIEASAADMAEAIDALLADQPARMRLSTQARSLVEERMSARHSARVFESICKQVVRH
ncbi:MAG: glycosyltransferase [Betaproteobacteria bacterium]